VLANGINNDGTVSGTYVDSKDKSHGFLWNAATGYQIFDNTSSAQAINNLGVVLGHGSYGGPLVTSDLDVQAEFDFGEARCGSAIAS
jgi:hypothetical protein